MAKLTKAEFKRHNEALQILEKERLSRDDKEFIFNNWHEGATNINSQAGAFFTPLDMAFDFSFDVGGPRVIDLCAGIGVLSYAVYNRHINQGSPAPQITCVERNPEYVEVGKRLLPEATWICGDVFDVNLSERFDFAVSNPPFGNIKREKSAPRYAGREFEYHVIDIASHIADYGVFIVPQMSAGFNYSGKPYYTRQTSGRAFDFQNRFGIRFNAGCGVDTSLYLDSWKGVSPLCEVICIDFTERHLPGVNVAA